MSSAKVYWFTGLSGSGKTTVAEAVAKKLRVTKNLSVKIFDGDTVRDKYHTSLGFSHEHIKLNNELIVKMCEEHSSLDVILVPVISPFEESRKLAKKTLKSCYIIYFSANLDSVIRRDVKGLYVKAKEGIIDDLIGFSEKNPYQVPKNPDLIIDSSIGKDNVEDSVQKLFEFISNTL